MHSFKHLTKHFSFQVAVIAGNLELAEVIQNHKTEDVGKCTHFEYYANVATH